jgi:hypothetical protein
MTEFVQSQILGTTFEVTSRFALPLLLSPKWFADIIFSYTGLQPVGAGAFGLIWYV